MKYTHRVIAGADMVCIIECVRGKQNNSKHGDKTMTTAHETLLNELAGQSYNIGRERIEALDWSDCYPVVDIDGDLTGEIADAQSTAHIVVDCTDAGVVRHPQAADAMIDFGELTEHQARLHGVDPVEPGMM